MPLKKSTNSILNDSISSDSDLSFFRTGKVTSTGDIVCGKADDVFFFGSEEYKEGNYQYKIIGALLQGTEDQMVRMCKEYVKTVKGI